MRHAAMICAGFLAWVGSAACQAQSGLSPRSGDLSPLFNSRFQSRLLLDGDAGGLEREARWQGFSAPRPSSATWVGSYYWGPSLKQLSFTGLRATGGLLMGKPSSLLGGLGRATSAFSAPALGRGETVGTPMEEPGSFGGISYVGLGYTGIDSRRSWGFSADLGLMSLVPGSSVRLGRGFSGGPNLDEAVRDLRLSPVLHLGISYSF